MQRFTNAQGENITIGDWCRNSDDTAEYFLIHDVTTQSGATIVWTQEFYDAGCSTGHLQPGDTAGHENFADLVLIPPVPTGYCTECDENNVHIIDVAGIS